jgi:hypothetical protein
MSKLKEEGIAAAVVNTVLLREGEAEVFLSEDEILDKYIPFV